MNLSSPSVQTSRPWEGPCDVRALFRCFRIAIGPGKMIPALLLVVLLYICGRVLDGVGFGQAVLPGEIEAYIQAESAEQFDAWLADQRQVHARQLMAELQLVAQMDGRQARQVVYQWTDDQPGEPEQAPLRPDRWTRTWRAIQHHFDEQCRQVRQAGGPDQDQRLQRLDKARRDAEQRLQQLHPHGVFDAALRYKLAKFRDIMLKAVDPAIITDPQARSQLVKPIVELFNLPAWLWHAHPLFLVVWGLIWLAAWSILGGTISRMAVVEAACQEQLTIGQALRYVGRRWPSYIAAPVLPLVLAAVFAGLLAVGGVVGFQWLGHVPVLGWVVDILLALLFCLALSVGLLLALLLIGYAFGVHLMYPALSAEGSDAFDAISRGYSYVFARPWRLLGYGVVGLVYGAATYLFVGAVIFLTLYLTHVSVGWWTGGLPGPRFEWMLSQPRFGQLAFESQMDRLNWSGMVASFIIRAWVYLAIGLVAAYAISYYFAATGVIYLLLRRHCDGTDFQQCYINDQQESSPPDSDAPDSPDAPAPDEPASSTPPADRTAEPSPDRPASDDPPSSATDSPPPDQDKPSEDRPEPA